MRKDWLSNWPLPEGFSSLRNSLPEPYNYLVDRPSKIVEIPETLANSCVLGIKFSSGTDTEEIMGVLVFRIDRYGIIDQQILIAGQNIDTGECWSHVHQHASYDGRTTQIEYDDIQKLWESSIEQVGVVLGLPKAHSGDIWELDKLGLVNGIHEAYKLKMNTQIAPTKKALRKLATPK